MREIIFKQWVFGRFRIRTSKRGVWFAVEYRPKKGWVHDFLFDFEKWEFEYNKLPF